MANSPDSTTIVQALIEAAMDSMSQHPTNPSANEVVSAIFNLAYRTLKVLSENPDARLDDLKTQVEAMYALFPAEVKH
jgi:pyruvate carboxylase